MEFLIDAGVVIQAAAERFEVHADLTWATGPATVAVGDLYDGTVFSKPGQAAPTLADRLAALATERYARQTAGVMFKAADAAAPSRVASDPVSTGMLTASYVAAGDGHWVDGTPWKMLDGSFVPLSAADMQDMALAALGYVSKCFAHESTLAAALATELTTDLTAGWPTGDVAQPTS